MQGPTSRRPGQPGTQTRVGPSLPRCATPAPGRTGSRTTPRGWGAVGRASPSSPRSRLGIIWFVLVVTVTGRATVVAVASALVTVLTFRLIRRNLGWGNRRDCRFWSVCDCRTLSDICRSRSDTGRVCNHQYLFTSTNALTRTEALQLSLVGDTDSPLDIEHIRLSVGGHSWNSPQDGGDDYNHNSEWEDHLSCH